MVYRRNDSEKRKRKEPSEVKEPTTVCYCEGKRELGTLELHCSVCRRWFHQTCLRDLKEFYGLPFMVCYVFRCQDCATDSKESWTPKQTNFAHMTVMALSNLTYNYFAEKDEYKTDVFQASKDNVKYFHLEKEIVPFFEENWESLSNFPRRVKNSWHQTIQKTLAKETELFTINPENELEFALNERNLLDIGPLLESIRKLGRRPPASQPIPAADSDKDDSESGPKTRGAAKRRAESSSRNSSMTPTKASTPASTVVETKSDKPMGLLKKGTLDANAVVEGSDGSINFPFNREGMQYFYAEKDPHVKEKDLFDKVDAESAEHIPPHIYRWQIPKEVVLSNNDRGHQMKMHEDRLTVTGEAGYCVARATHSVMYGKWYYEVEILEQPDGSHSRIGWGQAYAHLQACLGYSKFSYSWRSLKGTKFHDAFGKTYCKGGYGKGDILGCLIELPDRDDFSDLTKACRLPPTKKNTALLNFKGHIFFEEKEEIEEALKDLHPVPGSKITFFKNGKCCGTAFEDLYEGAYYPAISIYLDASLKCNFGPSFKYPPPANVRPISDRAQEMAVELALSDVLYLTDKADDLVKETKARLSNLGINTDV
uniref:B30.2/SPRY domain-containing protein n=1 Tax=Panagrolaimus superbus TaxID=310955 RepID=A0A914Y6U6_9BILA